MWDQIDLKVTKVANLEKSSNPWPANFLNKMAGSMILLNDSSKDVYVASVATVLEVEDSPDLSNQDTQDNLLFKAAQLSDLYLKQKGSVKK